ncbi:MAG: hypothetical protein HYX90_01110 [Chloroflexi bacterium]|nr:hypothetical protein [Chloroflexota bacterium]
MRVKYKSRGGPIQRPPSQRALKRQAEAEGPLPYSMLPDADAPGKGAGHAEHTDRPLLPFSYQERARYPLMGGHSFDDSDSDDDDIDIDVVEPEDSEDSEW